MKKQLALASFASLLSLALASPASAGESAFCGRDAVGVGVVAALGEEGNVGQAAPLVTEIDNTCAARADVEFSPAAIQLRQAAPARNMSDHEYRMLSDGLAQKLDMESGRTPWRELAFDSAAFETAPGF